MALQRGTFQGTRLAFKSASRRICLRSTSPRRPLKVAAGKNLQELKSDLLQAIEEIPEGSRYGPPPEAVMSLYKQMESNSQANTIKLDHDSPIDGNFSTLTNSSSHIAEDGSLTLGVFTFQQFGPKDAKIYLEPGLGAFRQGVQRRNEYTVVTGFRVAEGKAEGLVGTLSVLGEYELAGEEHPNRQVTYFTGIQLEPVDKSAEGLQAWLDFAKTDNPKMGEDGVVQVDFPQKVRGHRDFLLLDEELQVTIGNRGGYVVVKKTSS